MKLPSLKQLDTTSGRRAGQSRRSARDQGIEPAGSLSTTGSTSIDQEPGSGNDPVPAGRLRMRIWVLVLAIGLCGWAPGVGAETNLPSKGEQELFRLWANCVKVLPVVAVEVTDEKLPIVKKEGLKNLLENRLRSAGIYSDKSMSPSLYLYVHSVRGGHSISLSFRQLVTREIFWNDIDIKVRDVTTTWNIGSTGTHDGDPQFVRFIASEQVDKFIAEYLRVNESACR